MHFLMVSVFVYFSSVLKTQTLYSKVNKVRVFSKRLHSPVIRCQRPNRTSYRVKRSVWKFIWDEHTDETAGVPLLAPQPPAGKPVVTSLCIYNHDSNDVSLPTCSKKLSNFNMRSPQITHQLYAKSSFISLLFGGL